MGRVLFLAWTGLMLLSACGNGNDAGSGMLSISLTDTPVVDAEKVVIHFTGVQVHDEAGVTTEITATDPITHLPGRSIDLLQLQGDKSVVLFERALVAGNYSWIRLVVDFDPQKTFIQIAGQQYRLRCTSCQNNGYKLNRSFKVENDAVMAYMVDFDLRKSITLSNNVYHLRPTLRMVKTAASGHLVGDVDSTLINSLGGELGCMVYVYDGHGAIPGDIFLPEGIAIPDDHNNPVATAIVEATTHAYTVGFLAAGNYTVALTCDGESDNILLQDSGVTFHGTANMTVEAGKTTSHSF